MWLNQPSNGRTPMLTIFPLEMVVLKVSRAVSCGSSQMVSMYSPSGTLENSKQPWPAVLGLARVGAVGQSGYCRPGRLGSCVGIVATILSKSPDEALRLLSATQPRSIGFCSLIPEVPFAPLTPGSALY